MLNPSLNIDYISNLNFIDIVNLYSISSEFNNIDINKLLRQCIYNKTIDVNIIPNYNIYNVVKEFYTQLHKVIINNYHLDKLPNWVNREKFINENKESLKFNLLNKIYIQYIAKDIDNKRTLLNTDDIVIYLDKNLIISPLLPITINKLEYNQTIFKGIVNIFNMVKLSDNFVNYIKPSILNIHNSIKIPGMTNSIVYRYSMTNILKVLLFIRY